MKTISGIILSLLFVMSVTAGAMTAAGTFITNGGDRGTAGDADLPGDSIVYFFSDTAVSYSAPSTEVTVATAGQGFDASRLGSQPEAPCLASQTAFFPCTLTNRGNASDAFRLILSEKSNIGSLAFTGSLYSICQGALVLAGPSPAIDWTSAPVSAGASFVFEIKVDVPGACVEGDRNIFGLTVKNTGGAGSSDGWPQVWAPTDPDPAGTRDSQEQDFSVRALRPSVLLRKNAEFRYATRNDLVWFTISYSNVSLSAVSNCWIADDIPTGCEILPDSAESSNAVHAGAATVQYWDGAVWNNSSFDLPGNVGGIGRVKWNLDAVIGSKEAGHVRYCVRIR